MQVGVFTAVAGSFILNLKDAQRIMFLKDGLEWDFALDDGWIDPHYCKSQLIISKLEQDGKDYRIKGSMIYDRKPRRFMGVATKCEAWVERIYNKTGLFECKFEFTESSADLSEQQGRTIVQKAKNSIKRFSKKKTA